MSTISYRRLIESELISDSVAAYYKAPEYTVTIIKKLTCTNIGTDAVKITIYLAEATESPGDDNTLIKDCSLSGGETFDCFEAVLHVLRPGDTIQAVADTADVVNIMASGLEVQRDKA